MYAAIVVLGKNVRLVNDLVGDMDRLDHLDRHGM
jgi:hypothetical protein